MSQMKPILFNTEMVRAILDGRKTVTRRVVKDDFKTVYTTACAAGKWCEGYGDKIPQKLIDWYAKEKAKPQYQQGGILYVRETFAVGEIAYGEESDGSAVPYISQCTDENNIIPKEYAIRNNIGIDEVVWKPSIFMPKEAARIFLRVTNVRAERLQDITGKQAEKEGCGLTGYKVGTGEPVKDTTLFQVIWDNTVKPSDLDRLGWAANPWVWVYEFERVEKSEISV